MSFFEYGSPVGRKRNLRKGVWLRVRHLPEEILKQTKSSMRTGEKIDWVVVFEMRKDGFVLLEFWCSSLLYDGFDRYNVFYMVVKEDPNWICEGDMGRGFKQI